MDVFMGHIKMCQSTSKKNRQVSPPTCGPMDWFKGNFRGKLWKAPYFMGFYLWFPVRIFPNKPIHWKSLNHNFPMVFLWFLYGGWGSSGQLRQRSGPALFRCGLPDHSDLRLRDLRHATGGADSAVRTTGKVKKPTGCHGGNGNQEIPRSWEQNSFSLFQFYFRNVLFCFCCWISVGSCHFMPTAD